MKALILLITLQIILFTLPPAYADQWSLEASRPNIIFIFTDDLGYGDIESFGAAKIKTPSIDRMGRDGMKFAEFYSASPVCSPSRAGLLTGRYPIRMGINFVFFPESYGGLPPGEVTIAEVLRDAGYTTGIVGKWHLGHREKYLPLQQGFDEFFGVPYSNGMGGFYYIRGNDVIYENIDQRFLTRTFTRESIAFIEKHSKDKKPFFLYLAHSMPHVPLYVSPDFEGKSKGGLYGDVIEELDWSVGQILDKIKALGIEEKTLVIFSSDNGPWLFMGSHGGSAGILRDGKATTFEGGMRVPTLACWKGKIKPGSIVDDLATMMDWFPTFTTLSGGKLPAGVQIDGKDITQVLAGTGTRAGQDLVYYNFGKIEAYRSGDWKLKLPLDCFGYGPVLFPLSVIHPGIPTPHDSLLFNLKEDPSEKNNLTDQYPEKVRELKAKIEKFETELGEVPETQLTGKNANYSGFIRGLGILAGKIVLILISFVLVIVIAAKFLRKKMKR